MHTSSIPPVPNVIFAVPGATQLWPMRLPCWSPIRAHSGGAPGSAVAGPSWPAESTMVGSMPMGTPSASQVEGDQPLASRSSNPVTAALDASVTWTAPSVSTQAIHESTVPKHRSRARPMS